MNILNLALALSISLFIISCGSDKLPEITVTATEFTSTIAENPDSGDVIGTLSATKSIGVLTFSLSEQEPVGALAVDNLTGDLSVANADLFDFETRTEVTAKFTATATDIGVSASDSKNITITITDEEEDVIVVPSEVIWTGPKIIFTKTDGADENDMANQDNLTSLVAITRAIADGQIYNAVTETQDDKNTSPAGTEWAFGTTANIDNLSFGLFRPTLGKPKDLVGSELILHLVEENIYIDLKFLSWSEGKNKGGFSYERSTPE